MNFAIKITSRLHSAGIVWKLCFKMYSNLFGNILEFVMICFVLLEPELVGDIKLQVDFVSLKPPEDSPSTPTLRCRLR
jgi:hypothetical protein